MPTFIIAAGGESLSLRQVRAVGMAKAIDPTIQVIAINDAVYPFAFADTCYACDADWWRLHLGLKWFGGWKVRLEVVNPVSGKDTNALKEYPEISTIRSSGTDGFDDDPNFVRTGGNSGYQAVHMAVNYGGSRVILLGFDMKGRHWFGDHPSKIRKNPWHQRWIQRFDILAVELKKRDVVVLNASPGSALTAFPMVDLEAALQGDTTWSSRKRPPKEPPRLKS